MDSDPEVYDPSPEQVSKLVGCCIRTVDPLDVEFGGHRSRVFECKSEIGDLVLRVCKGQQGYYAGYFRGRIDESKWFDHSWAVGTARDLALPVPEVIATDQSRRWVVMRKLPGEPIHAEYEDWDECPYDERQFGEMLRRLHSAHPKGFGPIDDSGKGIFGTWSGFLTAAAESALETCRNRSSLPKDLAEALERSWVPRLAEVELPKASLLHMESLGFSNLMVDPESRQIVGLLDFEDCLGGDPLFETTWMRYYFTHPDTPPQFDFERFWQGYGTKLTDPVRERLYWPLTYLEKLRWIKPDGERAKRYFAKLWDLVET